VVMRRVLLFVSAFGVLLVRCRCFLVTLLHLRGCLVVAFCVNSYDGKLKMTACSRLIGDCRGNLSFFILALFLTNLAASYISFCCLRNLSST
jgi:hypothetical protein